MLLGEGNFTFTSALQLCCDSLHVPISTLTSTSYDSYDDLVAKYPGIIKELQLIAKRGKVQICHSVDATRLTSTLSSALQSESQPHLSTESEIISSVPHYDDIIFNFPHLGFEDLQAHRCLVAHIIHSAKEVLEVNGTLTIALAESQGINWGM